MKVYEIDDGEQWWYAADSEDEALKMHLQPLVPGGNVDDLQSIDEKHLPCKLDEIDVTELPDDKVLKVYDEENDCHVEKTTAEWAAEGKGFIAGTVW